MVDFKSFAGPDGNTGCVYSDTSHGGKQVTVFRFGPVKKKYPFDERTGRTGGQTGQTDGSGGRPADGGPEYSMPARPDSNLGLQPLAGPGQPAVSGWNLTVTVTRTSAAGPRAQGRPMAL